MHNPGYLRLAAAGVGGFLVALLAAPAHAQTTTPIADSDVPANAEGFAIDGCKEPLRGLLDTDGWPFDADDFREAYLLPETGWPLPDGPAGAVITRTPSPLLQSYLHHPCPPTTPPTTPTTTPPTTPTDTPTATPTGTPAAQLPTTGAPIPLLSGLGTGALLTGLGLLLGRRFRTTT